MSGNLGPLKTWKIVYVPKVMNGGMRGVAFVEADTKQMAMYTFQQQYAGQYTVIQSCEKLMK